MRKHGKKTRKPPPLEPHQQGVDNTVLSKEQATKDGADAALILRFSHVYPPTFITLVAGCFFFRLPAFAS